MVETQNARPEASREALEACLQKILSSPSFVSSGKLGRFLRYVVEETLEGRADRVKGYAIAVSVFDCGDRFDPQTNSVVRVEATRLRKRLEDYYAGPGKDDPIEIRINRGTYVPQFIRRDEQANSSVGAGAAVNNGLQPSDRQFARLSRKSLATTIGLTGIVAAATAVWLSIPPGAPSPSVKSARTAAAAKSQAAPTVTVTRIENHSSDLVNSQEALSFAIETAAALGRFDDVIVYDRSREENAADAAEYRLTTLLRNDGPGISVLFRLLRNADKNVVWSVTYTTKGRTLTAAERSTMIAASASAIARTGGIMMSERYKSMGPMTDGTTGFACVVHAARYYNAPSPERHRDAIACLERTVAADPKFARGHSALALLLLDGRIRNYEHQNSQTALARASAAAHEAIALNPQSA